MRWLLVTLVVIGAIVYFGFVAAPAGPRSLRVFDPDRTADLELDMWQAHYAKQKVRLLRICCRALSSTRREDPALGRSGFQLFS